MTEKELPKETPNEPKIQKFYKVCALIQNIFLETLIILSLSSILYTVGVILKQLNADLGDKIFNSIIFSSIFQVLYLIGFLTSTLFILIGISFYNRTDKIEKIYGKKFMVRGIMGLILIIIIDFIITMISGFFAPLTFSTGVIPRLIK